MSPIPEEHSSIQNLGANDSNPVREIMESERVVISGISGRFPQAHNVKELSDILYNKINPIGLQDGRWHFNHPELPEYVGKVPDINRFDAQFFTVYYRLGHFMDPISRMLLEQTYQAIYDAGLSPGHLNGKRVGVFVGSSFSDTEKTGIIDNVSKLGLGIVGSGKTMFANRISYWLNIHGPSLSFDEADCSATTALEQAYQAIKQGVCEAAIVGGGQLFLKPHGLIHHGRLGVVSKDGTTKSFAENSEGYALSDAVGVFFLQKSKDALRVHAELVHVKNNFLSVLTDETGPKFGYYRNPQIVADFIKEFYDETHVTPQAVEYVEAYGTGVPDADKSELEAIEKVYCENRVNPLLVGSITSNIGLTDSAAGITAITKVILGYHNGTLAANLNCDNPRKDITALNGGRMRIVTEHQLFQRNYTAVNGISVTGVNSQVLLHGQYKPKDLSRYKSSIPHLIVLSGRQETSVQKIFDDLKARPVDPEELALLHNIHSKNINGHLGRGYIVLDTDAENKTVKKWEKAEYFDDAKRPLWFVYSGMGSQWAGMGAQLMRIPVFASAIERCHQVLKTRGLDIVHIITSQDKLIFDNILNSFVAIAAIQIGLTDILKELGLEPDGIIGHSVGELGCAYADGCLTAEEMILAAYSRGLVSLQTPLIRGSMAAVGLGYDQVSTMCPPEIDVACRNSSESSTISGPADIMKQFVAELTAKDIFAKEVQCANIAYHSRYIAEAGPNLLKYLKEIIKDPKIRSRRWISTSVPQDKWCEPASLYCSAEYHTNNLLNPVLFEDTIKLIPSNATLVEVAPHGLLQAILKRALPAGSKHVPLTRRDHSDSILFLLKAIGEIYMEGFTLKLQNLYPKVQFPVSTETPMLSHLVEWVHSEEWSVASFHYGNKRNASTCRFLKSIHDEEYSYLRGNIIQEKMCYPFAAAMVAVWDTFSMCSNLLKRVVPIRFEDLHLYTQPMLLDQRALNLNVAINRFTGQFEVMHESSRVMTGYIKNINRSPPKLLKDYSDLRLDDMELNSLDIYQLLNDKNYNYSGEFRSIERANASLNEAAIVWNNNWVTFIDGLLQLNALRQKYNGISQPTNIRTLYIDVNQHLNQTNIMDLNDKSVIKAVVNDIGDFTRCGGILIESIKYRNYHLARYDMQLKLYVPPSNLNNVNNTSPNQSANLRKEMLQCGNTGKLDSLHWVEGLPVEQSNFTVAVHYAGLNVLDVKRATGIVPFASNSFGMDYSGTTQSGERVMGIIESGAASSYVYAQPELLWPVPKHWSLEDAATVPLAYVHAFYALKIKGGLEPGMSVLVHGGTGALGQAVIAIALAYKCQVFATVNGIRKKQFLRKVFPELQDEHITTSRDISFADSVLSVTKGRGCDLAVSCAKGQFKDTSIRCLGFDGIFIDTVQIQDRDDYIYGMHSMTKQRPYIAIDFSSIFTTGNYEEMKVLKMMLTEGIAAGYVVPLSRVTYAQEDATRAFRLLGASRHRGRVLLRMMCESAIKIEPRIFCDPDKSQVIIWDSDVFGVHLTERLVNRGAKNVYIVCETITAYLRFKIRAWERLGVKVAISTQNINNNKQLDEDLRHAMISGPIEGIYVIITKAKDKNMTCNLESILTSLDSRTRVICPQLRYFVVVSAVKTGGQQMCLSRAKSGFPATFLDLCSINKEQVTQGCDVAEVTEQALCCPHVVLLARKKRIQPPSLLKQIEDLADISIPQDDRKDVTLKELGMLNEKAPSIAVVLNDIYNISLDEANIPLLTIDKINDLQKSVTDITQPNTRGLETFFSRTDSDELLATADIVVLPTLFKDVISIENDFEIEERYMCIVPGMEGHHERFRVLCERLKLPALVLQPGLDHPHETAQEAAQRYIKILMKKTKVFDKFYILGYESGVMVALALAALLEKQGLTGTVFCLGFSPEELQVELEEQLSDFQTEEQLQDAVLRHMFKFTTSADPVTLDKALQRATTWKQKIDAYVRCSLGCTVHSAQYLRGLLEAALARIKQVRRYNHATYSLRSKLVLLRAASPRQLQPILKPHSQEPIIEHQLRSGLANVLNDMQCPSLINKYLDTKTLTLFEESNLCDSYSITKTGVESF